MSSKLTVLKHSFMYAGFEFRRLWQTRSGLMTLAATAVIWALLFYYLILPATELVTNLAAFSSQIRIMGTNILQHLNNWPSAELTLYWLVSLSLLPIFCLFFTANQVCSDLERGTLRFLSLRSSRTAILLGRFLGQMLVQGCLILCTLTASLIVTSWNHGSLSLQILNSALVMLINLLLILLPFTALMSVCSASVRSSKLAVTLAIVSWGVFAFLLNRLTAAFPSLSVLNNYTLGAQVSNIAAVQGWQTLQFAYLPLLQSLLLLTLAWVIINRRAL